MSRYPMHQLALITLITQEAIALPSAYDLHHRRMASTEQQMSGSRDPYRMSPYEGLGDTTINGSPLDEVRNLCPSDNFPLARVC